VQQGASRLARVDEELRDASVVVDHADEIDPKREVPELRRANEILKSASVFSAKELDRPPI
jgi:transposase